MAHIDLNCDLAEGSGQDAELIRVISSANIACGIHAGDVDTMRTAVNLAKRYAVAIGAHPSLNDRENFGRKEMHVSPREVYLYVHTQTKLLQIIARQCEARVRHVKPHGALYNMAARDPILADAVANAVYDVDPTLVLFGLAGSCLMEAGRVRGLQVASEVFADRTYQANGELTPRTQSNALITDEAVAAAQVLRLVRDGVVTAADGTEVMLKADTICLHGDGPHAVEFAEKIKAELKTAGYWLKALAP
jgi:UPF0271 protein